MPKFKSYKMNRFLLRSATYAYLIFFSIIILYPIAITVLSAFRKGDLAAFALNLNMTWTLDNFMRLFTETLYGQWYLNTLIIAVSTMLVQTIVIVITGYAFSRYKFVGRKNSLMIFMIIQMVPTMAALTAFFVVALMLDALNESWFLVLIYVGGGVPMNTWLMKGYFDTISTSLDEAAKLDGAGHFRIFWQIILPLVRPMVAVQALWAFMAPFGDFILSSFLLRTKENYTVAVGLQTFILDIKNQRVALFAAGAILVALPISILFFFLQKHFVSGLSNGGTKG